jgi:hypothetical protein
MHVAQSRAEQYTYKEKRKEKESRNIGNIMYAAKASKTQYDCCLDEFRERKMKTKIQQQQEQQRRRHYGYSQVSGYYGWYNTRRPEEVGCVVKSTTVHSRFVVA